MPSRNNGQAEKRPRARKIAGGRLGPFVTACTAFSAGRERVIEIELRARSVVYRMRGSRQEFELNHEAALLMAIGAPRPRTGRVNKRGGV